MRVVFVGRGKLILFVVKSCKLSKGIRKLRRKRSQPFLLRKGKSRQASMNREKWYRQQKLVLLAGEVDQGMQTKMKNKWNLEQSSRLVWIKCLKSTKGVGV